MNVSAAAVARWALAAAAVGLGVTTARIVRSQPDFALATPDTLGTLVLLVTGWALIAVGLAAWWRGQSDGGTAWFAAAGIAWFVAEWNSPGAGSSLVFTVGLTLSAIAPALVAHGALSHAGRHMTAAIRTLIEVGYAVTVVGLGVLPAMLADPAKDGCFGCPVDLLAVSDRPSLQLHVLRVGLALAATWSVITAAVLLHRAVSGSSPLRRARTGVLTAAALFLLLSAASQLQLLRHGSLAVDDALRRLRTVQGLVLVGLAGAIAWGWTRGRRTRNRVTRLVLDLAAAPPPGGLRDSLAAALRDETLQVGYWLSDGRLVDATGHPVEATPAATPLVRGGRPVALLTHRPGLLDDPHVAQEVAAAARLALDNERLHAEVAAQLARLRESRQRLITTADAARRRLERDLHDGAQQQLVGLLLRLRLERAHWPIDVAPTTAAIAAQVEQELQAAIEELRELARGIFPSVLAEEGLAAAVEDFAEDASVDVTVTEVPEQRLSPDVESASYFVVAESVRRSVAPAATVCIHRDTRAVNIEIDLVRGRVDPDWTTSLEDRVGALDGMVAVDVREDGFRVRAVIPCGS